VAYATRATPAQAGRFSVETIHQAGFNLGQIRAKFPLSAGRGEGQDIGGLPIRLFIPYYGL
jgi:hypothetical protein